ncbi:MAG: hypothetical protein ACREDI_08195, partial [Roseiarcus sp.]
MHLAFQVFAAHLDAVDKRFERVAPRREHLIKVALLAGEIARGTRQALFVACDRFGKAACFVERVPGGPVKLIDLFGDVGEYGAKIVDALAQRMLRRREIGAGRANRPLQSRAAVDEAIDHLGHSGP